MGVYLYSVGKQMGRGGGGGGGGGGAIATMGCSRERVCISVSTETSCSGTREEIVNVEQWHLIYAFQIINALLRT